MDKQAILQKYNKDEDHILVSKVLNKIEISNKKNKIVSTDFLDLYQKKIVQNVLKIAKQENYKFEGGFAEAERTALIVYPEKLNFLKNKNDLSSIMKIIRINLPKELYGKYNHKNYLGAIMKLGVKREKIGDIIVGEDGADIIVSVDIVKYIEQNILSLTRFSKSKIEVLDLENIREANQKEEKYEIIVSSLRLDNVISEILKISRSEANKIIFSERVFINFEKEIRNSRILKENDIITVRGKGRFKFLEILGETKKKRLVLKISKKI